MSFLQGELQAVLRLPTAPSPSVRFFDLGMDSLMAVELRNRLNRALSGQYTAPNTIVFDYPDTESLARHLAGELYKADGAAAQREPRTPQRRATTRQEDDGVAIVGMACRFPGAEDPAAFWRLLEAGETRRDRRTQRLRFLERFRWRPHGEGCLVPARRFRRGTGQFDAGFFRMQPMRPGPSTRNSGCCWRHPGRRWRTRV